MAKKNPFAAFEKSSKDKKEVGKEGSKREEAQDRLEMSGGMKKGGKVKGFAAGGKVQLGTDGAKKPTKTKAPMGMACGGKVKGMATGGSARGTGAAQRGTGFKSGQS